MFRFTLLIFTCSFIVGQVFDPQTGEVIQPQYDPQTGEVIEIKNNHVIINENISPQADNHGNKFTIEFKKQDLILRNKGKQVLIKENQKIYVNGHLKIYKGIDYANKLVRFFNTSNQEPMEQIISFDNIINIRYGKLLTNPADKGDHFALRGLAIGSFFIGGSGFLLGFPEGLDCAVILGGLGLLSGGALGALIGYIYGITVAVNSVVYSTFSEPIQLGPKNWYIAAPN